MVVLFILVPISVVFSYVILGWIWWAVNSGQFENLEDEGERILHDD